MASMTGGGVTAAGSFLGGASAADQGLSPEELEERRKKLLQANAAKHVAGRLRWRNGRRVLISAPTRLREAPAVRGVA
jgi:hypothetical protein